MEPVLLKAKTFIEITNVRQAELLRDGVKIAIGIDDMRDRHLSNQSSDLVMVLNDGGGSNLEDLMDGNRVYAYA